MSTADGGIGEPGQWPGEGRPAPRRPRPVPPPRRNQERRARRAARARAQREERRRRELERRRRERERREREQQERIAREAFAAAAVEPPGLDPADTGEPAWQPPAPDPWHDTSSWEQPAATQSVEQERPFGPVTQTPPAMPREPEPEPELRAQEPAPTPAAPPEPPAPPLRRPVRTGRRKVTIRQVDPWSVFRLSLVLYFCLLVIVTLGLVIFWLVLSRLPLLQRMLEVVEQLGLVVEPGLVLTFLVPVGLLNVLLWSAANLFFAVLYNLVADLVGGLRVTLSEEP